jgi:ubiquitin-protein ligase
VVLIWRVGAHSVLPAFYKMQMLLEPHADNPLEADIARQLAEDKEKFNITAAKWTMDYAS